VTGQGNLTVSGGGGVTLAGLVNVTGTHNFNGTVNLNGNYISTNNTILISGGTVNFNGTGIVMPTTLSLSGSGTLGGTAVVTVASLMNWTGGVMRDNGRTTISPGATLNIAGPSDVFLSTGRRLENGGTVLWTGGNIGVSTAVITNRAGALFEVRNAAGLNHGLQSGSRFDNAGTFRKSVSAGTTTIFNGMVFNNYNIVEVRSGILRANGGYTFSSGALLNSALGGSTVGTGFGQLQVAGTVNLNGSLSVDFINGFVPATNDSFTVVTAGTRNGTFANFYYPSNDVTMQLSNAPTSVIVRVTDVLVVPRPLLLQPELVGLDLKLTWTAVSNTTYRVEFNPSLNSTNWNALPGDVTSLTTTTSKLDVLTPSNRFYRVRVLP